MNNRLLTINNGNSRLNFIVCRLHDSRTPQANSVFVLPKWHVIILHRNMWMTGIRIHSAVEEGRSEECDKLPTAEFKS